MNANLRFGTGCLSLSLLLAISYFGIRYILMQMFRAPDELAQYISMLANVSIGMLGVRAIAQVAQSNIEE